MLQLLGYLSFSVSFDSVRSDCNRQNNGFQKCFEKDSNYLESSESLRIIPFDLKKTDFDPEAET